MHSSERVLISLPYITSKERCYERIYWKLKRQMVAGVHESYSFVAGIFEPFKSSNPGFPVNPRTLIQECCLDFTLTKA